MLDRVNAFLLALCIALGIALFVQSTWPYQSPPDYGEQPSANHKAISKPLTDTRAAPDKGDGKQEKRWYSTFTEHTPEWLIAIFTATLWWSTRQLWRAGEKQIAVSRTSADASLVSANAAKAAIRAVMVIKNYEARRLHVNEVTKSFGITPSIENVGPTHALNYKFVVERKFVPINDTSFRFQVPPKRESVVSVGPGTRLASAVHMGIDIDEAVRVWRGEIKCLIWCRLDYDDVLGDPHHTETCVEVGFRGDPRVGTPDQPTDPDFITYRHHGPQNSAS